MDKKVYKQSLKESIWERERLQRGGGEKRRAEIKIETGVNQTEEEGRKDFQEVKVQKECGSKSGTSTPKTGNGGTMMEVIDFCDDSEEEELDENRPSGQNEEEEEEGLVCISERKDGIAERRRHLDALATTAKRGLTTKAMSVVKGAKKVVIKDIEHSLGGDDLEEPLPDLTCAPKVTPDDWRVAVVPRDDVAQIFEDFHQAKGVLLVGSELALRRLHHLLRQFLVPSLGRELPALVCLLVPHANGPGLQPAEPTLGGAELDWPSETVTQKGNLQ